ncbi:MAG: PD40 domain-containing protein [Acidobacteria bacterium]|nr:PD40 domain-containing protein [Acidobacteriota bacterium]
MTRKLLVGLVLFSLPSVFAGTKLLRFPAIHGSQVAFTYAGDIWLAPVEGGAAQRLTSDEGLELFARFSDDGTHIAFTGQYEGDEQVYVIPTSGGEPKQLTFYPARGPLPDRWGYDNQVYGWQGDKVLFRSLRDSWDLSDSRLFLVSMNGGMPDVLPMPVAGGGALSPDGSKVVYSPLFRDFRTWKRYQGGWAQDLVVFDLNSHESKTIASHVRADRDPMWTMDGIYFNSDRDGHFNLYHYNTETEAVTQLTHNQEWDLRWPSSDGSGRIVYELGGELYIWDKGTGESKRIDITVGDDGTSSRPEQISVANQIEGFDVSPNAKRALFVARGDLFTAPVEHGVTRNLTRTSNAHEREASWSPDGKWIAYVSDESGEEHIYVMPHDGGAARQLTKNMETRLYALSWSPDSKSIAFTEKSGKVFVLTVASGAMVEVADDPYTRRSDYTWSPDSAYLAYSITGDNELGGVHIWEASTGESKQVTDAYFDAFSPTWDPNGDFLFYMSRRGFAPQIGSYEWNYSVDRETGIYGLALRSDVKNPFAVRNDDEGMDEKKGEDKAKDDKDKKSKKDKKTKDKEEPTEKTIKPVKIEFSGLTDRVLRIPVDEDNYFGLRAVDGGLVYGLGGPFYYGRRSDIEPKLMRFDFEKREAKEIAERIGGWVVSADGKSVMVSSQGSFQLYAIKNGDKPKSVSTANLTTWRVPREEWETIFDEVWRRFRDHFYVENMHGYDWNAIGARYRALLPHVAHRSDLNYILGEMVAELNVSHAYVSGGDNGAPSRPSPALLGAKLAWDNEVGVYRFSSLLSGHNEEVIYRSPLTEVGSGIKAGDRLISINGIRLGVDDNPYALLRHAGRQAVELEVAVADGSNVRTLAVDPISEETSLRYLNWVNHNREYVAEKTNGRVGYLHIPDMGPDGIREFIKWYYGQIRKEGLIVDVRGNGGGNVSQMIINRLSRTLLGLDYARNAERATTYPNVVFHGSMVCLLNETSASDGDIFPWTFRRAGLGPLIGKRSWGGIVGITNHGPLLDGGSVNVPEFGNASAEGEWVVEGHGVDPDIEVENDPASVIKGIDAQLDRGIEEVLKAMEANPMSIPGRPAAPVKTP